MSINLSALMKQRYDTAANWTGQNPTLLAGEIGIESDTKKWKVGTGSTAWTSLVYAIGGTYPIVNADIAAAAAIAYSKLATLTSGNIVLGSAANVATSTAVTGDVTISNTGVTAIAAGVIVNADINASAGIVDTKLATIATALKVSNSATTAASANTASAIVARDASGNFTAGTITAALTGAASSNVLKAGDTMTGVLAVTAGTAALPGIAVSGDPNTGIYSPGADQLAISTNGTERLRLSSTGEFMFKGAGTTPGTDKAVSFNGSAPANSLVMDSGGLVGLGISNPGAVLDVSGSGNLVRFGDGTNTFDVRFKGPNNWAVQLDTSADKFNIQRNSSSLVTITSGGLVGIGTASPANQLQLSTDSAGKPSSALWTIVSDERIKEDIELADLDLCYEAIKAIPLKRYKWRDEIYTAEQVTDRRRLGWIAQDVETVFPKAVGTHDLKYNQVFEETIIPAVEEELDADGNVITPAQPERTEQGDLISEDVIEDCRDLNADQLYAAMYGAVQKLMAKVETLETSNADLLARVAALEAA